MASLEAELRRVRKLAEERAVEDDGASRAIPHTAAWWDSLPRRRQIAELRDAPNRTPFDCPSLSGARCPHHVHALLRRAAEYGQRDWLRVDVARVWSMAQHDDEGGPHGSTWAAFFAIVAEIAAGDPAAASATMPPCPVCESWLCADNHQVAGWVRVLPLDKWTTLVLLGQNLDWRDPHLPSIETQIAWITGQQMPPDSALTPHDAARLYLADPAFAPAWDATVRDLADVLAHAPQYRSIPGLDLTRI